MDNKINLEEFISKSKCTYISNELFDVDNVKAMLLEFGKQLLELAYTNINFIDDPNSYCGNTGSEYSADQILDKKSFLNTINQIEQ
jgi:hypothetical protein